MHGDDEVHGRQCAGPPCSETKYASRNALFEPKFVRSPNAIVPAAVTGGDHTSEIYLSFWAIQEM